MKKMDDFMSMQCVCQIIKRRGSNVKSLKRSIGAHMLFRFECMMKG